MTATAAEPKAERTPIRIPFLVDPAELPLTLTGFVSRSSCEDTERKTFWMLYETASGSVFGRREGVGVELVLLTADVTRVEGRP